MYTTKLPNIEKKLHRHFNNELVTVEQLSYAPQAILKYSQIFSQLTSGQVCLV